MSKPAPRTGSRPLVGGVLAFDVCNTASGRGTDGPLEHLQTPPHLLTGARHAGLVDAAGEAQLQTRGVRLIALWAESRAAAQADLDAVAGPHAACLSLGQLTTRGGTFGWTLSLTQTPEEAILGPLAASAIATVMTVARARLKRCE